jgi:hypothetical protein
MAGTLHVLGSCWCVSTCGWQGALKCQLCGLWRQGIKLEAFTIDRHDATMPALEHPPGFEHLGVKPSLEAFTASLLGAFFVVLERRFTPLARDVATGAPPQLSVYADGSALLSAPPVACFGAPRLQ